MILQRRATVTGAHNIDLVGLNGTVLEETRNMLVLDTAKGSKMIPKRGSTLLVDGAYVAGDDLRGRPYERVTGP